MIKLFASDLDGTLLNALHETDGTIRRIVKELTDEGFHVVPATGRTVLPMGANGFSGMRVDACCANGSIIRSRNGEILKSYVVDPVVVEEILKAFPKVCFDMATPDGVFVRGSYEDHAASFKHQSLFRRIVFRGMRMRGGFHEEQYFDQTISDVLKHDVCKINCHRPDEKTTRAIEEFVAEHSDSVVNAPFDPGMFEITDKDCNKGESVAWLARYYGIDESEVAVYGDGGNDIAMLERFKPYGHSFATHGASTAAKAAASETIGSCIFHAVPLHMRATARSQKNHVTIA